MGWPAEEVRGQVQIVRGGREYDGRPIVPMDLEAVRNAARRIAKDGVTSGAVSAVFSPPERSGRRRRGDPPASARPYGRRKRDTASAYGPGAVVIASCAWPGSSSMRASGRAAARASVA